MTDGLPLKLSPDPIVALLQIAGLIAMLEIYHGVKQVTKRVDSHV